LLGLPPGSPLPSEAEARNELKLEAPLAVQGQAGHAGFFPFNKFSTVQLLIKAAREAYTESGGDDARKRVMVVPRCHVSRLVTVADGGERRVVSIETNQGTVRVPDTGKVVIALGTIESIRLALASFGDIPGPAYGRIGTNFMAHLRSNLDIRIPRAALTKLSSTVKALQAAALFVKGRHKFAGTSEHATFHLQITASGLGTVGGNSEAELFKKIPDIDTFDKHRNSNDTHVVMTIRAIGEMQPNNPSSRVTLDPGSAEQDEFNVQRALVTIADQRDAAVRASNPKAARDFELWNAMDQASKDVAKLFGVTMPPEPSRDGLGTTHHETGGLHMGAESSDSVTLPDGRLRHSKNAYVVGPALFPTIGSPNPMLTGVALARRLGDRLATPAPWTGDAGFQVLFNGFDTGTWRMTTIRNQPANRSNPVAMRLINGALETMPGNDMGIFWHTVPHRTSSPAVMATLARFRELWSVRTLSGSRVNELQQHGLRRGRFRLRSPNRRVRRYPGAPDRSDLPEGQPHRFRNPEPSARSWTWRMERLRDSCRWPALYGDAERPAGMCVRQLDGISESRA
jgi:hypothetical protein